MLKDKIILITGSSSGIGAATARLAKEYGAIPILHGKTESDELKNLAKELSCEYIFCDVADKNAVDSAVTNILPEVKRIDVLINCAGIAPRAKFLESDDDHWLDIYKINVLGTVHFCQTVIPQMQKNKYGRIVNTASIRAYNSTSGKPAYSASKASIVSLTAVLAKEFAPDIYVNAVAPGYTDTPIAVKTWNEEVWKEVNKALVGRIGQPKEIAEAINFMGSIIEINDTLQLTREQGFPSELVFEEHLKNPFKTEDFSGKIFEFKYKEGIRIYQAPPVRNFLVENKDGKWIYWGLCHVLETTCDYKNKITSGKFEIIYINTPEEMKKAHELIDRNPITNYFPHL